MIDRGQRRDAQARPDRGHGRERCDGKRQREIVRQAELEAARRPPRRRPTAPPRVPTIRSMPAPMVAPTLTCMTTRAVITAQTACGSPSPTAIGIGQQGAAGGADRQLRDRRAAATGESSHRQDGDRLINLRVELSLTSSRLKNILNDGGVSAAGP